MIASILIVTVLFAAGYFLMYVASDKIRTLTSTDMTYHFKTDVTIYTFLMMFISFLGSYLIGKNFSDAVAVLSFWKVMVPFVATFVIYGLFLMEMNRLFMMATVLFSFICGFIFIEPSSLMFQNVIPSYLEISGYCLIASVIALSGKVLKGVHGLFPLYFLMFMVGLALLAFMGGLPIYFAYFACFCCGLWVVVYQFNMYDENLHLSEGTAVSMMFLIGSLFLMAINELSFSSVFILSVYPITELLWALFGICFLKDGSPDLYMYTSFYQTYLKGVNALTLQNLLFKLLLINILFALVQLYAPNIYTFPILTFVFNFWMMSKFHSGDDKKTPSETLTETPQEQADNSNITQKDE